MITLEITRWYLNLLGKKDKNLFEAVFFLSLHPLSYFYRLIINVRNFLYDKKILAIYTSPKPIISIGNIVWAGTGKTTLTLFLYKKLSEKYHTAILRRGWGKDEEKLFKEITGSVFSSPNRVKMVKEIASRYDLFLMDDGFQRRQLARDINIVIISANDLDQKIRLIPIGIFREGISSLKRADILIINHKDELKDPTQTLSHFKHRFPKLKVYLAQYKLKKFFDLQDREIDINSLKCKPVAALTGTGYPDKFFKNLKDLGIKANRQIVYPDHYELSREEFIKLERDLIYAGVDTLVITKKDRYHIPESSPKIRIAVMEIEIDITNKKDFLKNIEKIIALKRR